MRVMPSGQHSVVALTLMALTLMACSGDNAETTGVPGCGDDNGRLAGNVYVAKEALGTDTDVPSQTAIVTITHVSAGEGPILVGTQSGEFSVSAAPGTWELQAEDDGICTTTAAVNVEVIACDTSFATLLLEECFD